MCVHTSDIIKFYTTEDELIRRTLESEKFTV